VIRLNLSGLLTVGPDGRPRLDGRELSDLVDGFHGRSVLLTAAEICGHRLADGEVCTMPPKHWPERNHCNLLEV
jgi:hypothetical protein